MLKRIFASLLAVLLITPLCAAEEKDKKSPWTYAADTAIDSGLWSAITAYDDEFYPDVHYEPVMLLASDGTIEAWLVMTTEETAKKGEKITSYLVMYVQREPVLKVLDVAQAGKRLKETAPTCELKFLLDSDLVLDGERLLAGSILEAFQMDGSYETISAAFLDTAGKDFLNSGWVNRIRVKAEKPKFSLAYKKRYPIENGDVDAALAAARAEGFSLCDKHFPAEIDWGYEQMTLSFTADADVKQEEVPDLALLSTDDTRQLLIQHMPFEERELDAGLMADALMAGPIRFLRYTGSLNGQEVTVEVWPLPDGCITEFSADFETLEDAAAYREEAIAALDGLGILLHTDSLKTQSILDTLIR